MRTATQVATAHKLGVANMQYGKPWPNYRYDVWFIPKEGGDFLIWQWYPKSNGCWKLRSSLPLFDSKTVCSNSIAS